MTRNLLAALAVVSLAVAGWGWLNDDPGVLGVFARVGVILAAAWIAWPSLIRLTWRSVTILGVGLGMVAWRPRSAWIVLPVLAVVLGRPRRRNR